MKNSFCHCELNSADPGKSIGFFKELFPDWTFNEMSTPNGAYTLVQTADGGIGGAICGTPEPGSPSTWVPYVMVEDIKATTAKLETMGATILHKLHDVGPGWITLFHDPTGVLTGLYELKPGTMPPPK